MLRLILEVWRLFLQFIFLYVFWSESTCIGANVYWKTLWDSDEIKHLGSYTFFNHPFASLKLDFREIGDDIVMDYNKVIMSVVASQITSQLVYSSVYSRHRSNKTSKLCVTGICAGNSPVIDEFPHKGPVTRKMFPFDDAMDKTDTLRFSKKMRYNYINNMIFNQFAWTYQGVTNFYHRPLS